MLVITSIANVKSSEEFANYKCQTSSIRSLSPPCVSIYRIVMACLTIYEELTCCGTLFAWHLTFILIAKIRHHYIYFIEGDRTT